MAEDIPVDGVCPSIASDETISPVWDDDREEYICPDCEVGLGETVDEAQQNARNHLISA